MSLNTDGGPGPKQTAIHRRQPSPPATRTGEIDNGTIRADAGRALAIALVLGAGACGSDADENSSGASTDGADAPAGPETSAGGDGARGDGTISFGVLEPAAIEPGLTSEVEGWQVTRLLFDGLTGLDEELKVVPAVASRWEVADDRVTWTFELQESTFSDGTPVTAQSFVDGFARAADPDLASPVAYQGSPIVGWDDVMGGEASGAVGDEPVSGVTAVDDQTLQIVTIEPFSLLPTVLTHPVFSPVPAAALDDGAASFTDEPIGNGPYQMAGPWEHNVAITVVRNEAYAGDRPAGPGEIRFGIYSDLDTMYRDVQAGSLDITRVGPNLRPDARANFGDSFAEVELASLNYIGFPHNVAPFDNPDIRRAMSLAIDREAVVRATNDSAIPAALFVPGGVPGAAAGSCPYCTFDPEQAKELYEKAGGIEGDKIVFYDIAGDGAEAALEAILNSWKTVLGIEAEVRSFEFAQYLDETAAGKPVGPFELGWVWDYPSPYSMVQPLYESTSGVNNLLYANPEFDDLMAQTRQAPDPEAGLVPLIRAQEVIGQDIPVAPLSFGKDAWVHNDRVGNVMEDTGAAFRLELVTVEG